MFNSWERGTDLLEETWAVKPARAHWCLLINFSPTRSATLHKGSVDVCQALPPADSHQCVSAAQWPLGASLWQVATSLPSLGQTDLQRKQEPCCVSDTPPSVCGETPCRHVCLEPSLFLDLGEAPCWSLTVTKSLKLRLLMSFPSDVLCTIIEKIWLKRKERWLSLNLVLFSDKRVYSTS